MTERLSVTQLSHGASFERKGKLVPTVLHLHRRTAKAYQCSVDGIEIKRSSHKTWEGFLHEDAVIEHKIVPPFIVLSVRSHVLIEKKLIGSARLSPDLDWTESDRKAFDLAEGYAAQERKRIEAERRGRQQILTSFGRDDYA